MNDYTQTDINRAVPRADQLRLITHPSLSSELIVSQWGEIPMMNWCELEAQRMRLNGSKAEAVNRIGITGAEVSYIIRP